MSETEVGILTLTSEYDVINRIPVIAPILGQRKWGPFFAVVYLPQKLVLSPPIERQYKPFQKHVSSYQVKRSPGCVL
jgi:hypothetical protein